ncbi:MAG: HEPN domain-containing protein [Roseburia sp.]|nr:HEPN domain-containing protein [Roseburia sp.]
MTAPTLLSIAKADLKTAKRCVDSQDKYEKHIAAYHTQQAVEKIVKYLAAQQGLNLWGHNIAKLISQCRGRGIKIPSEIERNADVYTMWETVSRYYPTQRIRRDSIQKAIHYTEMWIEEIEHKQ